MTSQPLDTGQASAALQSIVADYGASALSNAVFMNNVLRDLLPDRPREASVLVAAAEADVAGILKERNAQHINTGAAIAQAATTLGERTALTQDACMWAARQMAQALNLLPGQMTESRKQEPPAGAAMPPAGQAQWPPPPVPPAGQAQWPAQPTPPGGQAQWPTQPPPAGQAQWPAQPTPPGGQAPWPAQPTPPMPYQPTPAGSPAPRGPADAKRRQAIRIGAGAGAVIVLYLLIAAVAHLAPFGKSKAPVRHIASGSSSPSHSASTGPSPTPSSPSPTPTPTFTAKDRELLALIPTTVQDDGNCLPVTKPLFGSIASIYCHDESPIAAKVVDYYLFDKTVTMNIAYRTFLGSFAHTTEESISCSPGTDFGKFIPRCETIYDTNKIRQGRVVEYMYKNRPDMSWTVEKHNLLIDASGNTGTRGYAILRWWTDSATHWVEGGL